jgi:serine/threonine protein phosphatase PrpC
MVIPAISIVSRSEEARRGRGEDRIAIIEARDQKLVAVVDGAGGLTGGANASDAICQALTLIPEGPEGNAWAPWLRRQDEALAAHGTGLAAAVLLSISQSGVIHGASVGDCEAWLFGQGEALCLTAGQIRKPLLGDGAAEPVSFTSQLSAGGTLIVASDGLWKYVGRGRVAEAAAIRPLESALAALVEAVRLRNGALQDDVAIVLCEMKSA